MHSPILLVVAGYIGLRSLEIALRPLEAFRTRAAHRVMTISAIALFFVSVLFILAEILGAAGIITLPWSANALLRL
jgi:hypothetical protein